MDMVLCIGLVYIILCERDVTKMKCKKKSEVFEYVTFEELLEIGKNSGANIVDGMPWCFLYLGLSVTHETNDRYRVIDYDEASISICPGEILVVGDNGTVLVLTKSDFAKKFEVLFS